MSKIWNIMFFSDDLSTLHKSRGKGRKVIENKIEQQGRKVEDVLKKLGLKINNKKSQFIVCMNRQRRKPSVGTKDKKEMFQEKLQANIAGKTVRESDSLKTLGIHFDSELNFKKYWNEVKPSLWKRIFALSQLKSHLPFLKRKELGQGLILSKLTYCIEVTSCCPRNVFNVGKKINNRVAREVCGEYDWKQTRACYFATGWLDLMETSIFKTYMMANKLLQHGSPNILLESIGEKENGEWRVK